MADAEQLTPPIHGGKHLRRVLEEKREAYKEDVAREVKTHGQVRPAEFQVGTKTWKSYSRVRYTSKAFRDGFDRIVWS